MMTIAKGYYLLNGDSYFCDILRDRLGHFFIKIDQKMVHRKMNAEQLVAWFAGVFFMEGQR